MEDPFFIAPIPWLSELVKPWADRLGMVTLPLHIHEVVGSALFYSLIFWPVSPIISNILAPQYYSKLPRKTKLNWDAHVVSMVQSCLINVLAIWVMLANEERRRMDWEERVWGYTGAEGMIQALAAGYFVWDFFVSSLHFDVFGPGTLAHAIAALLVYGLGFRPLVNFYAPVFILWELSTPFLNVHWFMDKVKMTGSKGQLYNGIALLFTFFTSRLVFGTYQSYVVLSDIRLALQNLHPSPTKLDISTMIFATEASTVPVWQAVTYLASNLTLNFLNFHWFFRMIRAVRKRFVPADKPAEVPVNETATESGVDLSTLASGVPEKVQGRRRKA
ncbi:unnamed protein product [Clonostachys rhizophaga]|uniref:TLC domain-containing protein n=1 Tax=Clonostachys rhizophaga TaxID=160324 RepID=A0A9N9VQ68_9HYPO|nr:unnamed protein product [Clonostachys rhizophaga]